MDFETQKAAFLKRNQAERRRLELNLLNLTGADLLIPGVNGDWTVKDLLAHLVDWEQRFLGWYETGKAGESPALPAAGMTWRDLDLLNWMIYEKHLPRPVEEILEEFRSSYLEIKDVIENASAVELYEPGYYPWTGSRTLAYYAWECSGNHYRWAKNLIRKWLKSQSRDQKRVVV
ncbi:MAG TPA: ClbS/DfsB family four-helix bundle protein [Anaerolineaceae bacterium]|nr:ClbS/DfsB family four-helix bundle protein [Anaerolineaceae bacterium]